MIKLSETARMALILAALLTVLPGCQKQEGPAEKAGKQLDDAAGRVGKQIEKAGDSIQDAAKGEKNQ
jgi:hypothetical protein